MASCGIFGLVFSDGLQDRKIMATALSLTLEQYDRKAIEKCEVDYVLETIKEKLT